MNYLKILVVALVAVTSMSVAGSASATTVTSSLGSTPFFEATTLNSEIHGSFVTMKCNHSAIKGIVSQHGAGVTVVAEVTGMSFTGCNYEVTVITLGSLEIHGAATTGNGVLTSSGMLFSIHTSVGVCVFGTNGTNLGTVTGSNVTKSRAVLDVGSAKIPQVGSNFFCGTSGTWTGSYTIVPPINLEVH